MQCDVLIIGGGLAGLRAANAVAPENQVILVTKEKLQQSNSNYAQGGIAAVYNFEKDSFEKHTNSSLVDFEKKEIGEALILKHILFEPNMIELTKTSIYQADTLVDVLKRNPELSIEVFGYTDKSGIEEKNIVLSKNRAKALHDYLIEKGIDPDRLYYSGCGSGNPIASNKYRWGRDINRRIEVVIIKK